MGRDLSRLSFRKGRPGSDAEDGTDRPQAGRAGGPGERDTQDQERRAGGSSEACLILSDGRFQGGRGVRADFQAAGLAERCGNRLGKEDEGEGFASGNVRYSGSQRGRRTGGQAGEEQETRSVGEIQSKKR